MVGNLEGVPAVVASVVAAVERAARCLEALPAPEREVIKDALESALAPPGGGSGASGNETFRLSLLLAAQHRAQGEGRPPGRESAPPGADGGKFSQTAARVTTLLPESAEFEEAFRDLVASLRLARKSGPRDLMGRVYRQFLASRFNKHGSVFFTKPPSAVLLTRVALGWPSERLKSPSDLLICDFACGSGTLLVAAYGALKSLQEGPTRENFDAASFHRRFVAEQVHGFDASWYSVLMTEGTLLGLERGSNAPACAPNVRWMPLGGLGGRLGSLEFFLDDRDDHDGGLPLPRFGFDFVAINPPFARSCGDNLQFGHLSAEERAATASRLKALRRSAGVPGTGQAGQAADFVVLAQKRTRPGGRLAFVLPKSLLFGPSWRPLREFLCANARLEVLFVNYEPPTFAFSENSNLSEVMIVATNEAPAGDSTTWIVSVEREPADEDEAAALADLLVERLAPPPTARRRASTGGTGEFDALEACSARGRVWRVPQASLERHAVTWGRVVGFLDPALCRSVLGLVEGGELRVGSDILKLPLVRLGDLGRLGLDRAQITRQTSPAPPTDTASDREGGSPVPSLPVFWGRDNSRVDRLVVEPTGQRWLKDGQVRRFEALRASLGRLLVPETLFLPTTKVFAPLCSDPVLANVHWSFVPRRDLVALDGALVDAALLDEVLAGWFHTTVGTLLLLAHRQETRGPWVHFKKRVLVEMPALDVTALPSERLELLARTFRRLSTRLWERPYLEQVVGGDRRELDVAFLLAASPDASPPRVERLLDTLGKACDGPLLHEGIP
ncbi:MAG: hypothetical protein Kow0069_17250 [Promethearchaeota archaeon]